MVFNSVYDMTNSINTVRKQHFWEYFSGSKLQEYPNFSDDLTTNNGWVFPTNSSYDSTNDQIDLTIASNSFDVSYIDLQKPAYFGSGNNLDDDNFVIRAKITKNNDLGNTSKGGSLLLQVSSALTDSSKAPNPQDAIGMRIDTDRTGAGNSFFVHSVTNGRFWDGESSGISYSWGIGDLYWEIVGNGSTVTGELFTGSDYSTGSLGKVSTTQVAHTGMRYLKFCGFVDPSRTATQFSLQDFTIYNGVTSVVGRWKFNDLSGTGGLVRMQDAVNEGIYLQSGTASSADRAGINFNNERLFSHDSSVSIVMGKESGGSIAYFGLGNIIDPNQSSPTNISVHRLQNNGYYFQLKTADNTSASTQDSTVSPNSGFHVFKIINGSSNISSSIDGIVQTTKTSNRPTLAMQPILAVEGQGGNCKIRYMECFNT